MSTFAVFLSFFFFFVSFLYIHKIIHLWSFMRKTFLCTYIFLYMTNFFCTRIRTLLFTSHGLYTNPIYIQRFFIFPNTHLWFTQKFLHIHSLLTHTRIPFHASFTHKKSFYTHFPFSLYTQTFYSQCFFLFIRIFCSFYFLGRRS